MKPYRNGLTTAEWIPCGGAALVGVVAADVAVRGDRHQFQATRLLFPAGD
jgi:hypothetical protein